MENTEKLTTLPELDAFARLLKENGFEVILSREPRKYFNFFKNGRLGYVQKAFLTGGYDFNTVHIPCEEYGNAFGVYDGVELTLKNAEFTLHTPVWANLFGGKVVRYKSAEHYIEKNKVFSELYIL